MARLALVSRNPMMSMGLSSSEHDIEEIRASALADWLAEGKDSLVDALVLDLGSPSQALQLIADLRASDRSIPTLLVVDDAPDWQRDEMQNLSGVDFLTLPLDATKLRKAVQGVLRRTSAPLLDDVEEPPVIPEPSLLVFDELSDHTRVNGTTVEESRPLAILDAPPPLAEPPVPPPVSPEPPVCAAEIPVRAVVPDSPPDTVDPEPKPRPRRTKKAGVERASNKSHPPKTAGTKRAKSRQSAPVTPTAKPRRRATDHLDDQGTAAMVSSLLTAQAHLYTLTEASEVILDDALRRAQADAGALLVPDGEVWRVTAGSGVRPIELRYQLTADSWLIERVGASKRGIIILDTDIARSDLRGVPLASRPHLMALPVPLVGAVMLLARNSEPTFDEDVLGELAPVAAEAGPLLERSLSVRELARSLQRHLDPES